MRRIVLCMIGAMVAAGSYAQSSRVLNAWGYMEDNEYLKAKEEIEPATEHPKTMEQGKTWYYRGMIYENIYVRSNDTENHPAYAGMGPDALKEAKRSYEKALELGSNRINMNEVMDRYKRLSIPYYEQGAAYFNANDFQNAAAYFEQSFQIRLKTTKESDSTTAYNVAISAARVPDRAKAIEYYEILRSLNYRPAQVYPDLARLYLDDGQDAKAEEILGEGRAKMPNNQDLITSELNIYLERGEYDKALNNLNLAINNDPSNKYLYSARATIYNSKFDEMYKEESTREQAMESFAKAEADYKKAIEIDPAYFDALYNLGALYFNRGAELLNEANLISNDDEYKKAREVATAELMKALPFLEKAHEVEPSDQSTMVSLRDIYGRTNQTDKYDAMDAKLKN